MKYCVLLISLFVLSASGVSATIYVPDDYPTIQGAMGNAVSGDTIIVRPGTYVENVVFGSTAVTLRSEKGASVTTIDGNRSGSVVIFNPGGSRNRVLDGFTITNGTGFHTGISLDGGGIHGGINADFTVQNNVIIGNKADRGGGIWCSGSIIRNNIIVENTAEDEGGGICANSFESIANNLILKNNAKNKGGGIRSFAMDATMKNNVIMENTADVGGGIFHSEKWDYLIILNCLIANNQANVGGGCYFDLQCGPVLEKVTITGNVGGGIFADWMTVSEVTSSIVWGNGGSQITGGVSVDHSDVQGGWGGTGNIDADPLFVDPPGNRYRLRQDPCQPGVSNPCVDSANPNTMCDGTTRTDGGRDSWPADMGYHYPTGPATCTFYVPGDFPTIQGAIDVSATGDTIIVRPGTYDENIDFKGVAVEVRSEKGAAVTVIDGDRMSPAVRFTGGEGPDSVLDGFTVTNGRNGIECKNGSSPTITNNIIAGNIGNTRGGGIYCYANSHPTIRNNIVDGNRAAEGGGILCASTCHPTITNNIISNNEAHGTSNSHGGGGIGFDTNSSPILHNNTIVGNTAFRGGGILCVDTTVTITNTILWGNSATTGDEIWVGKSTSSSSVSIGHSDVEGGQSGVFVDPSSTLDWRAGMIDADPRFVDAAADDYHITFRSPCLNSGDATVVGDLFDFEGDPRIALGSAVDMGADEYWLHTYHAGAVRPGTCITLKVVGWPTAPVTLALGRDLLDPPITTPHGDLFLSLPLLWIGYPGRIPASGILSFNIGIPPGWSSHDTYYLQSLVGRWGGTLTRLTNHDALTVE